MNLYNILTTSFCDSDIAKKLFSFIGNIFNIMKIIIPIIIILIGTIDLIKAMIANDTDASKKAQNMFIKRLIIGIAIFFVFPIASFIMNLIGNSMDNNCMDCFNSPNNSLKCSFNNNSDDATKIKLEDIENDDNTEKLSESAER